MPVKYHLSAYEWFMVAAKVLGVAAAIFLYGEHQLSEVKAQAATLVQKEHTERREDYQNLDAKVTKIYDLLIKWDKDENASD